MNSAHSFTEGMEYRPPDRWKVGTMVRCVNGRFKGLIGIISYFNPEAHGDVFCMRVEPDPGESERVNPGNWEIIHKL